MKKLAIITTHPIQYYAPLFAILAKTIELKVFYTWGIQSMSKFDPGFERNIEWDIPLLNNYNYEFLINTSHEPGSHHFQGIINPTIIATIEAYEPDILMIFGWSYNSHLKVLRHFKGKVPILFRGDSTLLDKQNGFKSIAKFLFLKWVYSHIDKAFYVGINNRKYFERFGIKSNQLVFAPHAIDNRRFSEDHSTEAQTLRRELHIRPEEILILFAGKFEEKKDPFLLLSAFMKLKEPAVHLLFVGNGPLEHKLKSISAAICQRVHFLDFQNQNKMPAIYQASNLFCLPSKGPGETWGLAVNEAMACGRAILVSDKVGCAKDLVHSQFNGDIFEAGSCKDLYEKLKDLCDLNKLKAFGTNSKLAIQEWSYDSIARILTKEL